ncbi:MAG: hypothetical protein ABR543_07800 [Gemmatimonadaceae bacterium]
MIPSRRSLLLSFAVALSTLPGAAPATAQAAPSVSFAPGVDISPQQAAQIDSLLTAYRAQVVAMVAAGGPTANTRAFAPRLLLHQRYLSAIRSVLTVQQRATYDAFYAAAEAAHESRRPARP